MLCVFFGSFSLRTLHHRFSRINDITNFYLKKLLIFLVKKKLRTMKDLYGPVHEIFVLITLSNNKDSGESAHLPCLARVFPAHIHKV